MLPLRSDPRLTGKGGFHSRIISSYDRNAIKIMPQWNPAASAWMKGWPNRKVQPVPNWYLWPVSALRNEVPPSAHPTREDGAHSGLSPDMAIAIIVYWTTLD